MGAWAGRARAPVLLFALAAVVLTLASIATHALPWIEDSDEDEGSCSWVYAYVGAYTDGRRLINVVHDGDWELKVICHNVPAIMYYYPYVSPDYRMASTLVAAFIDPDRDGEYLKDSEAYAYIVASYILGR